MLKILQSRLQQYVNWEIPDVQAGFRKTRGTRDEIVNISWIIEKAREFKKLKKIYFFFTDYSKAFDCVDLNKLWKLFSRVWLCKSMDCEVHGILQARILEWVAFPFSRGSSQPRDRTQVSRTAGKFYTSWANCGKFLKRWEYQNTSPVSWKTCMRVKQQHFEPYMEQQTHLNLGKEFKTGKAAYCHPAYLTYMKSTSCKILSWMNHKLESTLPGEISTTSDMQMIPSKGKK